MTEKFDSSFEDEEQEEELTESEKRKLVKRIEKIIRKEGPMTVDELAEKLTRQGASDSKIRKLRDNIEEIKDELASRDQEGADKAPATEERTVEQGSSINMDSIMQKMEESMKDFSGGGDAGTVAALIETNNIRQDLKQLEKDVLSLSDEHDDFRKFGDVIDELAGELDEVKRKTEEIGEIARQSPEIEGEEEIDGKYKEAVKHNYSRLKDIEKKIQNLRSEVNDATQEDASASTDHVELEKKFEMFQDRVRKQVEELEENLETAENGELEVGKEEIKREELKKEILSGIPDTGGSEQEISSIKFDLESIKSRLNELEQEGLTEKLDRTEVKDIKSRMKKLEKKVEKNQDRELDALKKELEHRIAELEKDTVEEDDLEAEMEELEEKIDDRLRQVSTELDRAVKEGEDRLQSLEETVQRKVLEKLDERQDDFSGRIDRALDLVMDNQEFINEIQQEVHQIEEKTEVNDRKIETQVEKIEEEVESGHSQIQERMQEIASSVESSEKELQEQVRSLNQRINEVEEEVQQEFERLDRESPDPEVVERQQSLPQPAGGVSDAKVSQIENRVDNLEKGSVEELDQKIDNLLDHVISNQERIHELEQELRTQGAKQNQVSEDITIIS